jgi:hypothetical protein
MEKKTCRRLVFVIELQNILLLLLLLLLLLCQKIYDFFLQICLEKLTVQYVRHTCSSTVKYIVVY